MIEGIVMTTCCERQQTKTNLGAAQTLCLELLDGVQYTFLLFSTCNGINEGDFFLSLRSWRDYPSDCYCFFWAVEAREGWGQVEFIGTKFT